MRYEVRYMAHISLWSVVDTVADVGVRGFATRWPAQRLANTLNGAIMRDEFYYSHSVSVPVAREP